MDSERGRDSRRKKYSSRDKERDKEKEPARRMVILTKSKESKPEEPPPTILLKTRETERAVSPQAKEANSEGINYQLATRPVLVCQPSGPQQMRESVKLLDDETLAISDSLLDFLTDSNDFLVVGCIGSQGVGKSTVMSHLAHPASMDDPDQMVFKVQTKNHVDSCSHATEGIQAYVTNHRVIYLDVQPVLSLSVLVKHYASEGAGLAVRSCHRDDPDYPCLENDVDILSLQYIAFLLAVCHVVVVVQDYFFDPDLIRFLQTAEQFKPPTSVHSDEETRDFFPHCVFVQNKCTQNAFSNTQVKNMQKMYKAMFSRSQLVIDSGLNIANGVFMPSLSPELCEGEPINLYLLPEIMSPDRQLAYEVKSYEDIIDLMRCHIQGAPLQPLSHTTLSEKNWLHFAIKTWEDIKKSPLFVEYGRMIPTASSFKVDP